MAIFTIYDKEGRTLHTGEFQNQRKCVEDAISAGKSLANANLYRWNLEGCQAPSGTFTGADMRECNLANANFNKATLTNVKFDGSVLRDADFRGSATTGVTTKDCDLDVLRTHALHT